MSVCTCVYVCDRPSTAIPPPCCCNAAARGYEVAVGMVGTAARGTVSVARVARRCLHARMAQRDQREFISILYGVDLVAKTTARARASVRPDGRFRPWRNPGVTLWKLAMSGQHSRGHR
eukprot:223976-Chlamydomonas_euryale.AAC.2